MRTGSKRSRLMRRLAVGALLLLLLAVVLTATGWMAFHRIPSWYTPLDVAQADLSRVRNSLPNTYQELTDAVVRGREFEFALSDRLVTEWIVARAELYPDAREWLPDWVRDPVVRFHRDKCIIGARIVYQGWEAIIGIHVQAAVADDEITFRVVQLTAGALPVPLTQLAGPLDDLLRDQHVDPTLMPDPLAGIVETLQEHGARRLITEGVSFPNAFHTRNPRREVKIREVGAANGRLKVRIDPR